MPVFSLGGGLIDVLFEFDGKAIFYRDALRTARFGGCEECKHELDARKNRDYSTLG